MPLRTSEAVGALSLLEVRIKGLLALLEFKWRNAGVLALEVSRKVRLFHGFAALTAFFVHHVVLLNWDWLFKFHI